MSVHQLKDGRWIARYKSGGKEIKKYFGRGLEAEKQARQFNDSLDLRTWKRRTPAPSSALVDDLAEEYIKSRLAINQKSTIDNLMVKWEKIISPQIGHLQAINLTEHRMDQYVNKRLKAGVKRTTVHRELSDIQAILNWSVRRKYLSVNPIRDYEKPKRDDEIIQPPTIEEVQALLSAAADHLRRALILSFYTGIRPGQRELLSRCWHDVNWTAGTLFVVSAKKGGDIKSRSIPLSKNLLAEMRHWQVDDYNFAERNEKEMPDRIIHYRGKPILRINKAFREAKRRAKITRRLRPYDFRHAFASSVLKNNANLKATSELLGHSRTDTTTRIYQHTDTDMHRAVIESVPELDLGQLKDGPKTKRRKPSSNNG